MMKLRVGVMGCANIAVRTVIPTMKAMDTFEVVSVASRSGDTAKKHASMFNCKAVEGYEALMNDPSIDAIYMPLPTGLHEEWVLKTLDAGKHILVEKSLAMNYASAQTMVEKAKSKNLLIMENFMFLYHKQHQVILDMIADGEIGEIRSFRSSFGFPPLPEDNFRYNRALGGGALLDAAAYTVRASQLFLGNDISVQAACLNSTGRGDVDIYGGAFLSTPNGAFSEVAFGFDNFYQCDYEIWGTSGKITAKKAFTPKPNEKPKMILEKQDSYKEVLLSSDDHFKNILSEFRACIETGKFDSKYDEILNQSRLIQELYDVANGASA